MRFLHSCGLPKEDVDMVHCEGHQAEQILKLGGVNLTVFTGSSHVAEHLARELHGKIRLEDAGLDWKVLGPDVPDQLTIDYMAW